MRPGEDVRVLGPPALRPACGARLREWLRAMPVAAERAGPRAAGLMDCDAPDETESEPAGRLVPERSGRRIPVGLRSPRVAVIPARHGRAGGLGRPGSLARCVPRAVVGMSFGPGNTHRAGMPQRCYCGRAAAYARRLDPKGIPPPD